MFHTQCKIDYSCTLLEYRSCRSFDKRKSEAMFSQQPMLQVDNLYLVGAHYVSARGILVESKTGRCAHAKNFYPIKHS